ncbi:hypothetical protein MicloDRAFT_00064830 [Microvirga lotononidis]|uniref:Uncharacterized protein n=1 Tax=Microvirga lotononidis TaxID=864069 RepID=I4YP64_9HYPH|nr:hypothetical protein MicloDRAFT_00064830 [Microvirga lotononidis]
MSQLSKGQWGAIIGTAVAITLSKYDKLPTVYAGDIVAICIIGALLFWFLRPRADRSGGQVVGQSPSDSLAFRVGKNLKRVWGGTGR